MSRIAWFFPTWLVLALASPAAGALDWIELASRPGPDLAAVGDPGNLEALRPIEIGLFKPFSQFWGATVGFGFSSNSGNSRARGIAFSFDIDRQSPKDRQSIRGGMSRQLAPGEDGLVLVAGGRRATFLPQVWDSLPDIESFVDALRRKAGLGSDLWTIACLSGVLCLLSAWLPARRAALMNPIDGLHG